MRFFPYLSLRPIVLPCVQFQMQHQYLSILKVQVKRRKLLDSKGASARDICKILVHAIHAASFCPLAPASASNSSPLLLPPSLQPLLNGAIHAANGETVGSPPTAAFSEACLPASHVLLRRPLLLALPPPPSSLLLLLLVLPKLPKLPA